MNRSGQFVNNLTGDLQYKSFEPRPLPSEPSIEYDSELISLLASSNRYLGMLEGKSNQIPDIDLFVAMYIRKEALLSSQIEGTQATLDDVLDPSIEENINQDVEEVINYIKATNYAKERLKTLPLCNRLLLEIHKLLLDGARGSERNPGEFRKSQNWIGPAGSTLKTARYVPPSLAYMKEALSDLESYMNADEQMDHLIRIALIHYQFETIHPFLDGNGRMGRLLIMLYLVEMQLLSHDILYLSYYLKRNRIEYYDRLMDVRMKGNYEQWIKFFLRGISESARDALETIDAITQLHDSDYEKLTLSKNPGKILVGIFEHIKAHPITDINGLCSALDISYTAASNNVKKLVELQILVEVPNKKRNRVYSYEAYLDILRKDTELL